MLKRPTQLTHMEIPFVTVDVFTDRQFGGNPLAVVPDARGLTAVQMQAIAAEFNLSETTFVLPPRDAAHTAQVRIFTPRAELPFAGHPNVGTAIVLAGGIASAASPAAGDTMIFEEAAGLVRLNLLRTESVVTGARLAAPQPLAVGADIAPEIVAACCGLTAADITTRMHRPCIAGCGTPFVIAELTSHGALAAAKPRADLFAQHVPANQATGIHLYVPGRFPSAVIETRMFAPLHGVFEDPATGSANVALIGLLARLQPQPDLMFAATISQGVDMGRPSLMQASAEKRGGTVIATFIGGSCVPVMQGAIALGI
jgi:trans-2,3-dihydro-3-hydroxyanthranilate isomerase